MRRCKGIVQRVIQCSGCLEVRVAGEKPGTFIIDNCCVWSIVDAEGQNWIGRRVEYVDGYVRFLNQPRPRARGRSVHKGDPRG